MRTPSRPTDAAHPIRPTTDPRALRRGLEADVDVLERQARKYEPSALAKIRTGLGMHDAPDDEVARVGRARLYNVVAHTIGYATWNEAVARGFRPATQLGRHGTPGSGIVPPVDAPSSGPAGDPLDAPPLALTDDDRPLVGQTLALYLTRRCGDAQAAALGFTAGQLARRVNGPHTGAFDLDEGPDARRVVVWGNLAALDHYLREWAAEMLDEPLRTHRYLRQWDLDPETLAQSRTLIPFPKLLEEKGFSLPVTVTVADRQLVIVEQA